MSEREAAPSRTDAELGRVAEVVLLRRDVNRPFTYRIEEEHLSGRAPEDLPGHPVVVPLGSRLTVGLVVAVRFPEESPEHSLKPVRQVLEAVDPLPAELVELGRWVASYYATSPNRVFRALLPPRYLPDPERAWSVGGSVDPGGVPEELSDLVDTKGPLTLGEIEEATGWSVSKIRREMEKLTDAADVEETVDLEAPAVGQRRLNHLEPAGTPEDRRRFREEASRRQRELIDWLEETGGGFQRDLPSPLNRTDLLRRLEEEGLLERSRKVYRRTPLERTGDEERPPDLELTDEQSSVLEAAAPDVREGCFQVHLVHGVTGSGKTEVYFRLIQEALERERSALVLVPEILLASFLVSRFRTRFGDDLAVLHSGLSAGERLDEWRRIQDGEASVVLGVQSAVFAPLVDPGLIVVDEEHDTSYKAGSEPRYHARDVAVMRARKLGIPVILGSATPSLESYTNALRGRYRKHEMTRRPGGSTPPVRVVDLRGQESLLTDSLIESTREVLERGRKAIWFLNRRGLSNFLTCPDCGTTVQCSNCHVSLTLHGRPRRLRCHYCGFSRSAPDRCEECGSPRVETVGVGTEWLTDRAEDLFPGTGTIRMDSDTVTRREARHEKLQRFGESGPRLMVGTQMVTKGLDFEAVDFVGVVNADTGLGFPDFRAGERTFQQIVQVCGRAGRAADSASVLIQTYNPGHYAILHARRGSYEPFFRREAAARRPLDYPPFGRLVNVTATGEDRATTVEVLETLRDRLDPPEGARWLGPSPCVIDYLKGRHRHHLLARGHFSRGWKAELRGLRRELEGPARIDVDVDPIDLL